MNMMKLLKNIGDVSDFEIQNQTISILRGGMMNRSVIIYFGLNRQEKILENIIIPSFKVFDDNLWVYSKGKTFAFSKALNFKTPNIFIDFFPKYVGENLLIGDCKKNDERYLQARKLENEIVIWEIDFTSTIFLIYSQIYIVKFSENLQKFNLFSYEIFTGNPLWHYTLPEGVYDFEDIIRTNHKGEIYRIIGQFNDVLWIAINNGYLLGLNVNDGNLVYELAVPNNFSEFYPKESTRFNANYSQLDEAEGKLFGISQNYYWEIDLQDPPNNYILYNIQTTCDAKNVVSKNIQYQTWQQDEIIFEEWSFAQDPAYVGIFNRKTRQITWSSRELGEEGVFKGINKAEYQGNRLYVLDKISTLHIFEQESEKIA